MMVEKLTKGHKIGTIKKRPKASTNAMHIDPTIILISKHVIF